MLGEHLSNHRYQRGIVELARRDVDGHAHGRQTAAMPRCGLGAGGSQHPLSDRFDHPRFFSKWNELRWRHQPAHRVLPPRQRLHADDAPTTDLDLRLVVKHELATLNCQL